MASWSKIIYVDNNNCCKVMLYIFDFDGTIADTSAGIVRTMQATFLECGYQEPHPEAIRATIGLPLSRAIALLAHLPEGEALDAATATYRRLFESIGTVGVTLFPGVRETLENLHRAGHTLAIATGRGHVSAENFCRDMGILPLLSDIVADEDVVNKKPHAEPVLVLLNRHEAKREDALVVGDTDYDIRMGKAAGVKTCGVTYGNHSRERLSAAGADFIIDDFRELLCRSQKVH